MCTLDTWSLSILDTWHMWQNALLFAYVRREIALWLLSNTDVIFCMWPSVHTDSKWIKIWPFIYHRLLKNGSTQNPLHILCMIITSATDNFDPRRSNLKWTFEEQSAVNRVLVTASDAVTTWLSVPVVSVFPAVWILTGIQTGPLQALTPEFCLRTGAVTNNTWLPYSPPTVANKSP